MDIEIKTYMIVNGHNVSNRQLEVLRAISSEGSKTAAARKLGISVPVVHRYMAAVENAIGHRLMASTPTGTELTEDGLRILETAGMMDLRCTDKRAFTISCSPVTEELLMASISSARIKADLIISDDVTNLRMLKEGMSDFVVLDDPVNLFEAEEFVWTDIGYMDMVHVDNGPSYIRYKYGAQRIAFAYLDSNETEYTIDSETYLLSDLINSGKSFFIDEFLLIRKGINMKSATDKRQLRHSITAIYRRDTREITRILKVLQSRRLD